MSNGVNVSWLTLICQVESESSFALIRIEDSAEVTLAKNDFTAKPPRTQRNQFYQNS